ncbi:MAG: DNA repair protein RecO [candidate division Zixibacteria bacterium]|nr:DNA repair protein RecO [candidate division Zixibacteria bacterium]
MPLYKTNAVVLGSRRFGDTSKIISAYTAEFGKVHLLAKGALTPKSKFLSALETFSESELVFYHKTTTELHLLSQAALLKSHLRLADKVEIFPFAAAACEITDEWIKGEEQNPAYYQLLVSFLNRLEMATPVQAPLFFWLFVYYGASILGFRPNLEACFRCGKKEDKKSYLFHPEKGGLVCAEDARESERYLKVSADLKNLAQSLAHSDFEAASHLESLPSDASGQAKLVKELSEFLKDFLLVQGVWKELPGSLGLGQKN